MTRMSAPIITTCIFGALLWLVPERALAAPPCDTLGSAQGNLLTRARSSRRVLGELALLEARSAHEERKSMAMLKKISARRDKFGSSARGELALQEELNLMLSLSFGFWHTGENFTGFRTCSARGGEVASVLERNSVGVFERVIMGPIDDAPTPLFTDIMFFYLRTSDGTELSLAGRNPELNYAQSFAGVRMRRQDLIGFTLAMFTLSPPKDKRLPAEFLSEQDAARIGVGERRERSAYLSVELPRLRLSLDVVGIPGAQRGVEVAQLGLNGVMLPGELRLDGMLGYLSDERGVFAGLSLGNIFEMFEVQLGAEASSPYLKFARVRWERPIYFEPFMGAERAPGAPAPNRLVPITLTPYVEASINQDASFQHTPLRAGWLPGTRGGLTARLHSGHLTLGLDAHVGLNTSQDLLVMPELAGHFSWGTAAFLNFGL